MTKYNHHTNIIITTWASAFMCNSFIKLEYIVINNLCSFDTKSHSNKYTNQYTKQNNVYLWNATATIKTRNIPKISSFGCSYIYKLQWFNIVLQTEKVSINSFGRTLFCTNQFNMQSICVYFSEIKKWMQFFFFQHLK